MNKPLTFENVQAINTGGTYTVGTDGKPVRDDKNSTSLKSIAEGAPGPVAESRGAATDGVAPAQPEAGSGTAAKPKS